MQWHTYCKKTIEALLVASKDIGLEVNAGKTTYTVMSRDQHVGQNGYIQIGNKLTYLGTNLKNKNSMYEEINSRLKSRNAIIRCRIFFLTIFHPKNIKCKIYETNFASCFTWV
jgi:hypothetical protein